MKTFPHLLRESEIGDLDDYQLQWIEIQQLLDNGLKVCEKCKNVYMSGLEVKFCEHCGEKV